MNNELVQTALRNLPQYISKSGLTGPDKYSAMRCFEVLRDALAEQRKPEVVDYNYNGDPIYAAPEQPGSSVQGKAVAWQRRVKPDSGKWLAWEYFAGAVDYDNDPAKFPDRVGRWECEYRALCVLATPPPAPAAEQDGYSLRMPEVKLDYPHVLTLGNIRRALAEYPVKNPQLLQANKVCLGVLALAVSYGD